jgi:hypothetical protein
MNLVYVGFDKKVSVPGIGWSIFEILLTLTLPFPSTSPFSKVAISFAENSIRSSLNFTLQK